MLWDLRILWENIPKDLSILLEYSPLQELQSQEKFSTQRLISLPSFNVRVQSSLFLLGTLPYVPNGTLSKVLFQHSLLLRKVLPTTPIKSLPSGRDSVRVSATLSPVVTNSNCTTASTLMSCSLYSTVPVACLSTRSATIHLEVKHDSLSGLGTNPYTPPRITKSYSTMAPLQPRWSIALTDDEDSE